MIIDRQRSPMLDYVTKLMLLELVRTISSRDLWAVNWIETFLTELHHRWSQLDGR